MTFKMELDKFMKQLWTEWYSCFQGADSDDMVAFSSLFQS